MDNKLSDFEKTYEITGEFPNVKQANKYHVNDNVKCSVLGDAEIMHYFNMVIGSCIKENLLKGNKCNLIDIFFKYKIPQDYHNSLKNLILDYFIL